MTIRLLRTLVAVADNETFNAAAKAVHVTHAAVSQQMQNLEGDLGIALFDRKRRTPVLTPVGWQIVEKARMIIADYDNLVPSVLGDGGFSGVITLGALRTTLTGLTPQALASLKTRFPELGLHIRPGLTGDLISDIERGTLDAAIVTKPILMPKGVLFHALAEEPMQLIAAREETLEDPIELLKTRPFIRFNRNAVVGTLIDNWILSKRIRVSETMELDSPEAIASMVHANLGVSIVPAPVVKPIEGVSLKHVNLGPDAPRRILGLMCQENHLKMRVIDEVYDALMSTINDALPR